MLRQQDTGHGLEKHCIITLHWLPGVMTYYADSLTVPQFTLKNNILMLYEYITIEYF